MKPDVIKAMAALFEFAEAMSGDVTIGDLREVMSLAVESGHDMLRIQLAMAQIALEEVPGPEEA